MEKIDSLVPPKKFESPQEELEFLRERVRQIENTDSSNKEEEISQSLKQYAKNKPEDVMVEDQVTAHEEGITLDLPPEDHDSRVAEFIDLIETKGVANTIDIVSKMENPHISDDFHRFLVEYVREGYVTKGLDEGSPVEASLRRRLFEIQIPDNLRGEEKDSLSEIVSMTQQMYAGLLSISDGKGKGDYFTLEIANPIGREDFIFYISVPEKKFELFQKQIHSFFPDIKLEEHKNDFNIFNIEGQSAGGYIMQKESPVRMLRTIEEFEKDPINAILNVFSNLDESAEGAAIQFIFKPVGGFYEKNYIKAISKIEDGNKSPDEINVRNTALSKFSKGFSNFISKTGDVVNEVRGKESSGGDKKVDSILLENVRKKTEHPIVSTNIKVIASSRDSARATSIAEDILSAFNQFKDPVGNSLQLNLVKENSHKSFFKNFSYRNFEESYDVPLNLLEIATIFHFPGKSEKKNPNLSISKSVTAPAPINLKSEGILLGINSHAGKEREIHMSELDRMRHMYVIGQTGTGKTNFMKSMIIQDIKNGDGVCMIDPHGSDIQDVLANVPPERYDDVIYFDPAHIENPMGLNMLEYDKNYPEQKTFVVNELFSIFMKLYGSVPESMGPMFEQYFRNATMLVIEDPDTGNTLLDVSRVMADKSYRDLKISRCKNPIVVQFWKEIAEKAGGEASLANIVPYITSKFDVFLANDIMRPIIAQEQSSFNFRKIMDEKKILLVNLSKGRLGDINSNLIGLIIVGKILMAALSRVDSLNKELSPFYLYIDEFQNITTDSISTILSEARKYKLSLNIAHQYIAQLEDKIKNSVFGNVGTMVTFRVGSDDAEYLSSQFSPVFSAGDIMNIDNYNAYIKLLSSGVPQPPFNIKTLPAPDGDSSVLDKLKEYSYVKYGRSRSEVEDEIMAKYKKSEPEKDDISKRLGL